MAHRRAISYHSTNGRLCFESRGSLSPRMDELFLAALRDLAARRPKSAAMTALVT
jgi:hypothetical protein